jgi:hypothetical protein
MLPIDVLPRVILLTGCTAIKCYVCAPVPEIGETCGDAKDTSLDECGATTDSCHVLFIQQVNGQLCILTLKRRATSASRIPPDYGPILKGLFFKIVI